MTPKEKAKEIVEDFNNNVSTHYTNMSRTSSKQCALIAVKIAEKSEYNVLIKFGLVTENYKSDYWQEVKKEIEIL
jgi:hypothetical protein